ncbi:M23 family metallopeptidase [Flaviflexus huanghaiensis]|uniref:M23 family metallopeptidase n=1 Tax=Flaviflexus huanghaiensis TaxID=1111473 RepID=UPI0015F7D382|nr:M23 family metallopeptidase [Flaviflexus huanghaiensis]
MKLSAIIAAAVLPFVPTPFTPSGTFDWPLPSKTVLREFDKLEQNWHPGHRGVDVAGVPGEPVRAAGAGTVVYARRMVDTNIVSIEHADRLRTTYQPVTAMVKKGDVVDLGDIIGTLDEGHCLVGACLHWGAKRGDIYYDPLSLLAPEKVRVRLYPVTE